MNELPLDVATFKGMTTGERSKLNDFAVSGSQFGKYEDCPRQWELQYKLWYKGQKVKRSFFEFGKIVHQYLERVMQLQGQEEDGLFQSYMRMLKDMGIDDNFRVNAMNNVRKAVPDLLDRWKPIMLEVDVKRPFDWEYLAAHGLTPQFLYDNYEVTPLPYRAVKRTHIMTPAEDLTFRAITDLYCQDKESGEYLVVDHKTGAYKAHMFATKYVKQIRRNAATLRAHGHRVDKGIVYFVETDKPIVVSVSEQEIEDDFIELTRDVVKMMTARHYPAKGMKKRKICPMCRYNVRCRLNQREAHEPLFQLLE